MWAQALESFREGWGIEGAGLDWGERCRGEKNNTILMEQYDMLFAGHVMCHAHL